MSVTIYHNPRCSKSRATLALIKDQGIDPTVVEYLSNPPDPATLTRILGKLQLRPAELMRTGEAEYKAAKTTIMAMDDSAQIAWLCANPRVIERPVVISARGACIGRPPENVLDIL